MQIVSPRVIHADHRCGSARKFVPAGALIKVDKGTTSRSSSPEIAEACNMQVASCGVSVFDPRYHGSGTITHIGLSFPAVSAAICEPTAARDSALRPKHGQRLKRCPNQTLATGLLLGSYPKTRFGIVSSAPPLASNTRRPWLVESVSVNQST